MNSQNIIVVPLYKIDLNHLEFISIEQCFRIFKAQEIVAIKPIHLDISPLLKKFPFSKVISFEDIFFKDIDGYNSLMLSPIFYEKFLSYDFLLIYQTDAFVFNNELDYWCNQGYDYIGAPWLNHLKNKSILNKWIFNIKSYFYIKFNITKNGLPKSKQFYNKVGNGGFSLRNIKKFHSICLSERIIINYYTSLKSSSFNEDLFWSIEVNRKKKRLSIPNYKVATLFSIETNPDYALKINKTKLPFGCHAWEKNLDFWKDKIENCGYRL